jgi:tRNA1(Val) A37 N6-methylase TrmN6
MQVLSMNLSHEPHPHTVDAFHRGRFVLVQPKGSGHRSGIDAMLLAGAVPTNFAGQVVDLGAGAGAAGLAVASRCAGAIIALVERDAIMAHFARMSVAHPDNSVLAGRAHVIQADVSLTGKQRLEAGLLDNHFDFAIMNPPFNLARDRQTPDALKSDAHVMTADLFEAWLRTAAAILKASGEVAVIARPQSLPDIFEAMKNRFGGIKILPVSARANEPAIRVIVCAKKGSRADLAILPPLVLHGHKGNGFLERTEMICNGVAGLFE